MEGEDGMGKDGQLDGWRGTDGQTDRRTHKQTDIYRCCTDKHMHFSSKILHLMVQGIQQFDTHSPIYSQNNGFNALPYLFCARFTGKVSSYT